jgi:hypothetical protein
VVRDVAAEDREHHFNESEAHRTGSDSSFDCGHHDPKLRTTPYACANCPLTTQVPATPVNSGDRAPWKVESTKPVIPGLPTIWACRPFYRFDAIRLTA